MSPSSRAVAHLREALSKALTAWTPPAELDSLPSDRLSYYSHELALGELRGAPVAVDISIQAWVARSPAEIGPQVARRHYVVADEVDLASSSAWFPTLLGAASRLRSHLSPDQQADILLLLVAAPGSTATGRTAILERNEAFAQVLVWAPGADEDAWKAEAQLFVRRLRLGPIETPTSVGGGDLSPVDSIFHGANVPAEVRSEWQDILMDSGAKHNERAKRLLAVMDDHAGGTDAS